MIEGYFGGKGGQTPICGYCSQKVSVPVFHGYFERNDGRLRMPSQGKDERDEVGIRWSGRVRCCAARMRWRQGSSISGLRIMMRC